MSALTIMNKLFLVVLINLILLTGCSGTMPKLGINNSELAPCPKTPNCVSSQATDEEHYIEPVHFTGEQQEARDRILSILESEKLLKNSLLTGGKREQIDIKLVCKFFYAVINIFVYY